MSVQTNSPPPLHDLEIVLKTYPSKIEPDIRSSISSLNDGILTYFTGNTSFTYDQMLNINHFTQFTTSIEKLIIKGTEYTEIKSIQRQLYNFLDAVRNSDGNNGKIVRIVYSYSESYEDGTLKSITKHIFGKYSRTDSSGIVIVRFRFITPSANVVAEGGGLVKVLGRMRKIVRKGRTQYVTYKKELIKLSDAKKLEKAKKKA